jgi:hypothetical protein
MGLLQPMGVGWGDSVKGRGYAIEAQNGQVFFHTAAGMNQPPAGSGGLPYIVQTLSRWDATGIVYHRFNLTLGRGPQAPVLGRFVQFQLSGGWSLLVSVILLALCVTVFLRQRRRERDPNRCRNCGYDLRATPERCPECGLVPAASPPPPH